MKEQWDMDDIGMFVNTTYRGYSLEIPLWMRCMWSVLYVLSRKQLQGMVIFLVLWYLCRHFYHLRDETEEVRVKVGPASVCGNSLSNQTLDREKVWKSACKDQRLWSDDVFTRDYLFGDITRRFLFCSVPMIKDVFWKRVIRYVNNVSGDIRDSFVEIPEWLTYFTRRISRRDIQENTVKFIFSQDPYTRLWDIWVKNFYLSAYWFKNNAITCECNLSFPNFLDKYVALEDFVERPATLNLLWRPQVYTCNICALRPTFVGKVETFQEDAKCVLKMSNLSWILSSDRLSSTSAYKLVSPFNERRTALRQMRTLVMENLARWNSNKAMQKCMSLNELVARLWRAFKYGGYIPPKVKLPKTLRNTKGVKPEDILTECSHAFYQWPGVTSSVREELRAYVYRRQAAGGYSKVSEDTKIALEQIYAADFVTFGYVSKPMDIFYSHFKPVKNIR